jgi:hypothetical protein
MAQITDAVRVISLDKVAQGSKSAAFCLFFYPHRKQFVRRGDRADLAPNRAPTCPFLAFARFELLPKASRGWENANFARALRCSALIGPRFLLQILRPGFAGSAPDLAPNGTPRF